MFEPLEVEQDDKYKRFGKRSFVFVCMLLLLFFVLAHEYSAATTTVFLYAVIAENIYSLISFA